MTFNVHRLQVRAHRCKNCLYGPDPIPTPARAAQIRAKCARDGSPFECHLGTISGEKTRCRGWFDANQGSLVVRLARMLDLVDWIEEER